ncbi:unnamed protein product [Rotaria socialis]|nr:unnamed protein product [Rotaria socialis]
MLPDGMDHSINHENLYSIRDILPDDDDLHAFSLACLMQIYNQPVNFTSKQIYEHVLKIFNQLKYFVANTPIESRPLTLYAYQQAVRFQNEIENYSKTELNDTNQWLIGVKQLWILLKPYQNVFSLTYAQTIEQNLRHQIQSLQLTDLSSRLSSLVYLKSIKARFTCISIIDEYIRIGFDQIDNQIIDEFECFCNFINKCRHLLDLLVRYVTIKGEQYANELHRLTPIIIEHLETIFYSTLAGTEINNGRLCVSEKLDADKLKDFQDKLDSYLNEIKFLSNIKSRYGLDHFITDLAYIFDENRSIRTLSNEQIGESRRTTFNIRDPRDIRKQEMQTKIDRIISNLTELTSRAGQLPLRPHNLIQRMHHTLHQLKNFHICQENQATIQCFLTEEAILVGLVEKFQREINHYTAFHVHLPNDEDIHEISADELIIENEEIIKNDYSDALKAFLKKISNHSQSYSFTDLSESIRLIHAYVSNQMWIRTMCLSKSSTNEQLRTYLILLNDDLAIQCGYDFSNSDSLLVNVALAYGQFRCDILTEETKHEMLSNYAAVARLTIELQDWMGKAHLNVFNILENIKTISDNLNRVQNQLRNYNSDNISFSLLPIEMRPEDLICLFAPECTAIIQSICSKVNDIDEFLSNRTAKVESIPLLSTVRPKIEPAHGLSSYVYLNQPSTPTYLFDRSKHIHYIIDGTIHFLQKLINSCIDIDYSKWHLLQIVTGYKELFPLHMSISLAMMIIVSWSADYLKDFQSFSHLLTIVTLKEKLNDITLLRKKIEEERNKLTEYQNELQEANKAVGRDRNAKQKRGECSRKYIEQEENLQQKAKQQENDVDDLQDDLNKLSNSYHIELKTKQEQCFDDVTQCLNLIFCELRIFIIDLIHSNQSSSMETHAELLVSITSFAQQELLKPKTSRLDLMKIIQTKQIIDDRLKELGSHAKNLSEKDPLYHYIRFYCDILRISFCSLKHSCNSWIIYTENIKSLEIGSYLSDNSKRLFCKLNKSTHDHCLGFIGKIRTCDEESEIMKHAQEIRCNVINEIHSIESLLTGQQFSQQIQSLIQEFERFVINLLIIGCRYLQLQRGTYEPLDDLLSGITVEVIDPYLPRKELELLQLLDMCEMQLKTHCDTLLLQRLHIAFEFNSNPFSLFTRLDRSAKALTQFILPAAHMIQRMWLTMAELINKASFLMTEDEYEIVLDVCNDFLQWTQTSSEIKQEYNFIPLQLKSNRFEQMSKNIDRLCQLLLQTRSKMNPFCENMNYRRNSTLKEILQCFVEAKTYELLSRKKNLQDKDMIRLSDIESVLKSKKRNVSEQINFNNPDDRFRCLQTLYHLIINGMNNLGSNLMNIPTRHVDHQTLSLLEDLIQKFYDNSEQFLFVRSLNEYFTNNQLIEQVFESLETIHRLELKIFQDRFSLSTVTFKERYREFCHSIDIQDCIEDASNAVEQWKIAGERFIDLRRKQWLSDESLCKQIRLELSVAGRNILSPFLKSHSAADYEASILHLIKQIQKRLQYEQVGSEFIFTLATSQTLVRKVIDLYHKYVPFPLQPLNERELFQSTSQVFVFDIELNHQYESQTVFLHIWESDEVEPSVKIPIEIFGKKKLHLFANTQIKKLCLNTAKWKGYEQEWRPLLDKSLIYSFDNIQMRCHSVNSEEVFYTVHVRDHTINKNDVLSVTDLQKLLKTLEKKFQRQISQKKEQSDWKKSIVTRILQSIVDNLRQTNRLFQCTPISDDDSLTSWKIYSIYQQLPCFDAFEKSISLLQVNNLSLMPIPLKIVEDKNPAIHLQLHHVWTRSMNAAYQLGKRALANVQNRLFYILYHLRLTKAHAILCYALENARLVNINNACEQIFENMTKNFKTLNQNFIGNKSETIKHVEECKRIINEATQIYRTIKRIGIIGNDMKHLEMGGIPTESNMNEAFFDSQMDRDVHLWLINNSSSNLLECIPQSAILDFGITRSGVYQRLIQRIFIHNHSGKDITLRIKPFSTHEKTFDVIKENLPVSINAMAEFEVLLKPPTDVKIVEEEWNLIIDETITLENIVKVLVRIVEVDVELSSDTIKFGNVACGTCRIEEKLFLNNVLNCPLRIKAQFQATELSIRQSTLTIADKELHLPANSKLPFTVALETCDNHEEDINADVVLAVDTRNNLKWIKILAHVKRSSLKILYQNHIIVDNDSKGHLAIDNFYPHEVRRVPIEFYNSGLVEYTLYLTTEDRALVIIHDARVKLSAGARTTIEIEVNMPSDSLYKIFNIDIQFLNIRRQCKLTLTCKAVMPALEYHISEADKHCVIIISNENDKKEIWDSALKILKPIKHQVTFHNTSSSAATLQFDRILIQGNPLMLPTSCFDIQPKKTVVPPQSQIAIDICYHPKDLCPFHGTLEFTSNAWDLPEQIPYNLEFHRPIVDTNPRTIIDIGLIEADKNFRNKLLCVENKGHAELRGFFSGPYCLHSLVKLADLESASSASSSSSLLAKTNDGFIIDSKKKRQFFVRIEFDSQDTSSLPNIINLFSFRLVTECDPVIDIHGMLVNRELNFLVIGHTRSLPELSLPDESDYKQWSSLKLLPSAWLYSITTGHQVSEKYTPAIVITAIGHICGSQQTKEKLPITLEEWTTFCSNFTSHDRTLDLEMFDQSKDVNYSIKILSELFKNSNTDSYFYAFFYHLAMLNCSFSYGNTINTHLFASINSTKNTDEVYAMQCYSKRFSKFYEKSSSDDSHRQSICFLRECISNDSVIPKHVLDFVEFMYEALNLKTVEAIIKHLYAIFPENDTISELLTIKIDSRGKHRWPLLFALISDNIRDIAIRLISEDYEELLNVHLRLINEQPSIFCGQAVLKTVKTRNNMWNLLTLNDKNTHLEPFFTNYPNFTSIFARLSNQKQPKISDVLLVTEIILKHFNQLQDFNKIDTIFQAIEPSDIRQALNAFPSLRDKRSDLASNIFQLKKSFSDNLTDERTRYNQIDNFCTILQQLVILNDDQLKTVQSSIRSAWSLLCVVSKNDTRLSDVIDRALHLLYALDNKNEFALVRDAYKQFCSTPSWTAMQRLTNIIHSGYEINNLIEKLNTSIDEEEMASNAFRICRYLSTSNEQVLFDKIEIKTQELSSTKLSNIELLKQIEESASNLINNKAQLFLQSIRTFELILSKNAHDDQSLFKSLASMWQTVFDITCSNSLRIFEIIESMLTSCQNLIITKEIPLCQELYMTNLAAALCMLASYRQDTREMSTAVTVKCTTPSIMSIIRSHILNRSSLTDEISSVDKTALATTLKENAVSKQAPTMAIARLSSYTEGTLKKMHDSISDYFTSRPPKLFHFEVSDTVKEVINIAFIYRTQIAEWYDAFMTFYVLIFHSPSSALSSLTAYGSRIVENGLCMLRDLIVIIAILEPTFTRKGIQFLVDDLARLENCFRSLSLENYPNLKMVLRLLHIDINHPSFNFQLPSRTLTNKGKTLRKLKFDLDVRAITASLQTLEQLTSNSISLVNDDNNFILSKSEHDNVITNEIYQKNSSNETTTKITTQLIDTPSSSITNNGRSRRAQRLTNYMLNQRTSMQEPTEISGNSAVIGDNMESIIASSIPRSNLDLSLSFMREYLKHDTKAIDFYRSANQSITSIIPEGRLDNRSELQWTSKPERWTYQMLVETPVITRIVDLIIQEFRASLEKIFSRSNLHKQHEIQWCIMIDNSGSMSIHRHAIYESLVVLMELLRRLESKFAVARFGGRTNQKILKNLDDLFTIQDGQYVLEALTFDEGTYPATGLARVADRVFPEGKNNSSTDVHVHQFMIMITDGLTNEREDATYLGTTKKHNIDLGILFIETDKEATSQVLLDCLTQVQNVVIKSNKMAELPHSMPKLLYKMIEKCLNETNPNGEKTNLLSTVHIVIPSYDGSTAIPSKVTGENIKYSCANPCSYAINHSTFIIPESTQIHAEFTTYVTRNIDYTDYSSHAIGKLRQYYESLKISPSILDAEKTWLNDENRFSALIDVVSTVFGELIFRFNRFTRRREALRGSSLYMPGVIKALATDWNHKKIFGAKLAGGKRDHTICLIVDVSTSMFGTLSLGTLDAIVVLIAALIKIGIDKFSIVVFGRTVRLIKTNEQGWNAMTIYTLMQELCFDRDDETRDADALEVGVDLLQQCSTRGEKKIFILTDGYSSCRNKLIMVQERAVQNGIDIIAMAIGIDKTNLEKFYKRYLQCATVYGLPKALRALFEHETEVNCIERLTDTPEEQNMTNRNVLEGLFDNIRSDKIFSCIAEELTGERRMKLINDVSSSTDIILDICFCIDCTGSMSPWLSAMKLQMQQIISGIKDTIRKKHGSLNFQLRLAIVGYRDVQDHWDDEQFCVYEFTNQVDDQVDQVNPVDQFLNKLTATGGDDLPEDVLGALHRCSRLNWWKPKSARCIVLITDAPGHGELNEKLRDNYPKGVKSRTLEQICDRLLTKNCEIDLLLCCIKNAETQTMQKAFTDYYKRKDSDKSFTVFHPFQEDEQVLQPFHFLFVLDGSNSMNDHWKALERAYVAFLESRKNHQGDDDMFSVVQFSDEAQIVFERKPLTTAPRSIKQLHGGTNYYNALKAAEEVIQRDSTRLSVVMIFMSDGQDQSQERPASLITDLKQKYNQRHNFKCHTVAFGEELSTNPEDIKLLNDMALCGRGKMYETSKDDDLRTIFCDIAAENSNMTAELVDRFADTITKQITKKIMLDFL